MRAILTCMSAWPWLLLSVCSFAAPLKDRDALLGGMHKLMTETRVALGQLQELERGYASASGVEDIRPGREALQEELNAKLTELGNMKQEFQALNRGELYVRGAALLRGGDKRADVPLATFLTYEEEPVKVEEFVRTVWEAMTREKTAFEELELRLEVRRQRRMAAAAIMAAAAALLMGFVVWRKRAAA
jgi:hypothetical protein